MSGGYELPKRVTLNLDKVGVTQVLPSGLLHAKVSLTEDMMRDMLVARLTAYVLSEHLATDTVTDDAQVPATWWDHAKESLAGWVKRQRSAIDRKPFEWWLKRHPVKRRTVTLSATWTRRATRPHSTLQVPDRLGAVVYQEEVSHSLRWDDEPPW